MQSLLFARDPWLLIGDAIRKDCPKAKKLEALAYLDQAKDFFGAASVAQVHAARPLTLYYSFMNLVKAFCLTRGPRATFDRAQHGLSEKQTPGTKDFAGAFLIAFPSLPAKEPNNFAELKNALTGSALTSNTNYPLPILMPQIVPGHRLWALAAKYDERFVALHEIRFIHDRAARQVWLELVVVADDLSRLGITQQKFLNDAGLSATYHAVDSAEVWQNRPLLRFEQTTPTSYPANHPADILPPLTTPLKNLLWSTVSIEPPYRRQYIYLAPNGDRSLVLPQLLSIYATMYYFGSITRYRPHQYDAMIQGPYGSWIQEFFNGQPLQFVYLMASEFMKQDVTKPAIL